jgi:serine/threonine protein kinase
MTAYSLLAGELALELNKKSGMSETIKAIFEQPAIPLRQRVPELPQVLCEIVDRALAKDPNERWQTAKAMRTALHHASN